MKENKKYIFILIILFSFNIYFNHLFEIRKEAHGFGNSFLSNFNYGDSYIIPIKPSNLKLYRPCFLIYRYFITNFIILNIFIFLSFYFKAFLLDKKRSIYNFLILKINGSNYKSNLLLLP